jgi:threonine/homoserine/homoserine lactone efflux protein
VLALDAAVLGFAAAASPGSFQALLLDRAARRGPRRALRLALVPLLSDPPVVVACLMALSGVPPGFLRAVRLLGGLLLVSMGARALRELGSATVEVPKAARPRAEGFVGALLVNLLNPNVWLFWSVVGGPLLVGAWRVAPLAGLGFLVAFYLPLTLCNAVLVLAFGGVGALGPRARRGLTLLSGAAFLALGAVQLVRAAT